MTSHTLQQLFKTYKEKQLHHRYIFSKHILPLLKKHTSHFEIEVIGQSVLKESIYAIKMGSGKTKIFMWSQMHGNESTTTKAIFDMLNVFAEFDDASIKTILNQCTIAIIPMLNPDGAKAYTRLNANQMDLNRDAQDLTQPESLVLRQYFDAFQPHFCFNLHGQRTIFSAGNTNNSATVSFLAPAQDAECTITETRKKAMEIIVEMNKNLQKQIPNQVGIYDDAFNLNCVGDTFQSLNVPTVLFEAGHFVNDYEREQVRSYIFQSILLAIHFIASAQISGNGYKTYFKIPQNEKLFYDIVIRNAKIQAEIKDIAIQYQEILKDEQIEFVPKIEKIGNLDAFFGHKEIDAKCKKVTHPNFEPLEEGNEIVFVWIDDDNIELIMKKN
ncbi:MAG: peptidase M14 [Gelidibacter sp.]|nr:peptidase M14 [Gelidibacter sp.]